MLLEKAYFIKKGIFHMRKETASRQVCTGAWDKEKSKGKMTCRAHLASLTLPSFWPGDWRTERGFSSKIREAEFICEAYSSYSLQC